MATQGPYAPSNTFVVFDGLVDWTNPDNIQVSDDNRATSTITGIGVYTHSLCGDTFGFDIPSGVLINSISLEIERKRSNDSVRDLTIRVLKDASDTFEPLSPNLAITNGWPSIDTVQLYSSVSPEDGGPWKSEDVNSDEFGFQIQAIQFGGPSNAIAEVDYVQIRVIYAPPTVTDVIPLFLKVAEVANTGLPLFIEGGGVNESIPLFLSNRALHSNNIPLYTTVGTPENSSIPLFTTALDVSNSSIPLFTEAIATNNSGISLFTISRAPSGVLPLYLKAPRLFSINDNVPLYAWGTTNSGMRDSVSLFVKAEGLSGLFTDNTTLYLKSPNKAGFNDNMPLFLKSAIPRETAFISLFAKNTVQSAVSSVPLFLQVQSGTLGAIPTVDNMSLFIQRMESKDIHLPLYLLGPSGFNQGLELFLEGQPNLNSGIPLFAQGLATFNDNISLYGHGF